MSKKSPELRFKGFTDDWEERKLGEIFNYEQPTKYIVKSTEYDDNFNTPVLTAGKSFLLGYTDEITGIKNATVDNPVVIFDDFTTGSHYVDFPFKIKSSAMKLLSLNDNSDNFYFMFNTLKNIKYVPQSHERHWISKFSEFEIYKPSQEEQQKIGSFFKQLDETIALHQRKLDLLKEQKKGFLQKMFPKNGAKVPELRFKGFTDEWEQRKLSNESTIIAGGDIDKSKLKEVGEYPIFANALTNDGTVGYYDSYYRVEAPAVTVTGRGDVGHAKARKVNFTPVVRLLAVKSNHDVDFLENAINNHKVLVESTGVPQLTAPQLGNYKIFFPTGEEQQKIGSFFKQLDDIIALHQRKLDLLKEQKKGFLQKMFV